MITKPMWRAQHADELKVAQKLAARVGGATVNDLMARLDIKRVPAQKLFEDLVLQGVLKSIKTGHRSLHYEAVVKPKFQPSVQIAPSKKLDPNAPLIITPQTKITKCPSPPADQTWHKSQFSNW